EQPRLKLLYFTASWCGPCQLMKQKTWPTPIVQEALEPFDFQMIDVDAQKEVARSWSVRSMPTYLVVDPNRQIELARMSGFMDSQRMAVWLRNVDAKARQSLASILEARKTAQKNWAALAPLEQANPQPAALKKGQEALHTLLQHRGNLPDQAIEELDERLHAIAGKHPEYLAPGILHEDLQVRAYIARALAAEEIYFDPWASETARKEAYAALLQTL
ncbi:MAG TPA: thioredoxin family protein, partial [Opitutales bacterium]|nr:thioredoxin family protein [Opitutales bacterium]